MSMRVGWQCDALRRGGGVVNVISFVAVLSGELLGADGALQGRRPGRGRKLAGLGR